MQLQSMFFGFIILYAVLVCVACSQLEKLTAKLRTIRQKRITSQDNSRDGSETDQREDTVLTAQSMFWYMQKQLHECVRHHQLIMQYVYTT